MVGRAEAIANFVGGAARLGFAAGLKLIHEGRAPGAEAFFEAGGTIAIAAGPGFGAVFVAAFAAVVGVLNFGQIEKFLPVRLFFLKRRGAIADFDPASGVVVEDAGVAHVAKVFAFGDRAATQGFVFDGLEEGGFAAGFDTGSDEIAHKLLTRVVKDLSTWGE
jgi:hypothetical protein